MPEGTEWSVEIKPGEITRRIVWGHKQVAIVNPYGDFTDDTEKDLAAGLAFSAKMHLALRGVLYDIENRDGHLQDATKRAVRAVLTGIDTIDVGVMVETEVDEEDEGN